MLPNHQYPIPQREPLIRVIGSRRINRRTNSSHRPVTVRSALLRNCNWSAQVIPFSVSSLGKAERTSFPDTPERVRLERSFAHLPSPDEIMARSACLIEPRAPTGSGFCTFEPFAKSANSHELLIRSDKGTLPQGVTVTNTAASLGAPGGGSRQTQPSTQRLRKNPSRTTVFEADEGTTEPAPPLTETSVQSQSKCDGNRYLFLEHLRGRGFDFARPK